MDSVSFDASVFEANESDTSVDVMLVLKRSTSQSESVPIAVRTMDILGPDSALGTNSVMLTLLVCCRLECCRYNITILHEG